jgi:hypothetical protein
VTWEYDAAPGDFIDIAILAAGYEWQQIPGLELTAVVRSIPVTQAADIVYDGGTSEAVTFNGGSKRITCDSGNTSLDVVAIYSEWVDWALIGDNLRFLPAFRTVGGDSIDPGAGTSVPAYAYLRNGWRVRPQEANHTLAVTTGILLVDGGGDPFVDTLSPFTVRVNYQQPVQAMTVNTGGSVAPSQGQIQTAVRAELATEMARIDVAVSTRATPADTQSVNIETINGASVIGTGTAGDAWRGVGVAP